MNITFIFNFQVRAGQVSATSFLDLLESYADETDFTVWSEIDASIDALGNCLERTDYYEKYQKFIRKVYEKIGGQLGWDPKSDEGYILFVKYFSFCVQSTFGLRSYR